MTKPRPPYLLRETNRHGTTVWYVRRGAGARVRIRGEYGSGEFMEAYHAAVAGKPAAAPQKARAPSNSIAWLVARYLESAAWGALADETRKSRGRFMRRLAEDEGLYPYSAIERADIAAGMDRRRASPGMANNWLNAMRALFGWAKRSGFIEIDPTHGVAGITIKTDGFHVWTDDEVAKFEARWPLGTRERLAFAIMLYTGLRRSDAIRVGRQHIKNGVIYIRTGKTGTQLAIPVLPVLQQAIDAGPVGGLALISWGGGKLFRPAGFAKFFATACRAAGVPGRAHGLRKAGATRAAEAGASEAELRALFGWSARSRMAAMYTEKASRAKLAERAVERLRRKT